MRCGSFWVPSMATCRVRWPMAGLAKRTSTEFPYAATEAPDGGVRLGATSSASSRAITSVMHGIARASAIVSAPASAPRYAMAEWTPLRARSFSRSHGPASSVITAPADSHAGRPPGKSSSMTHCRKGSAATAAASATPSACSARARVCGRGRRDDAVDHRGGERHVGGHPVVGSARAGQAGQRQATGHERAQARPVGREVVATDQGERSGAGPGPRQQPTHDQPRHGHRGAVGGEVGEQVRVGSQRAGGRVELVGLLRHGERHHPYRRIGQPRHDRPGIARGVRDGADAADHAGLLAVGVQTGDAEQVVLCGERRHDRGRARRDADDRPVAAGGRDGLLGEDGLVGAVERTQSQVDDAGATSPGRIRGWLPAGTRHSASSPAGRPGRRRHPFARPASAIGHRHAGPSGKLNSAMDSGRMVAL